MKASPNREQLLFLIAGGIILILILAVVAMNLLKPSETVRLEEEVMPVKVTVLPPQPESEMETRRVLLPPEASVEGQSSKPAPVFSHVKKAPSSEVSPSVNSVNSVDPVDHESDKKDKKTLQKPSPKVQNRASEQSVPVKKQAPKPKPKPKQVQVQAQRRATSVREGGSSESKVNPKESRFSVQLGSFADRDNAEAVYRRVTLLNVPAYLQTVVVKGRKFVRVRAGPFQSRLSADRATQLVKKQVGISGITVPYGY